MSDPAAQAAARSPAAMRAACEQMAAEAGDLLRSRFGDPGIVRSKGDPDDLERRFDVVTEVDDLSEQLIIRRIGELNPEALVLGEEGGLVHAGTGSRREDGPAAAARTELEELWLVDPLDGTINFAHGIPHFCVSIACWRRGRPVAGAIRDPMVGETFSFEWEDDERRVAYHDGSVVVLGDGEPVSQTVVTVGGGGTELAPLMRRFRSWRRIGSAALALAWVGAGRCGAYVVPPSLHPWDWGAGVPFVMAAGGVVSDAGGELWQPPLDGTTGIIAAPRAVHAQVAGVAATLLGSPA